MNNAIEFLKKRRSIYAIGKNIELNNEEITELIEGAVKNPHSTVRQSVQ